jgi:hypothetical protein
MMVQVCLLCLMEMTFRREATQRQIKFTEIAEVTQGHGPRSYSSRYLQMFFGNILLIMSPFL